MHKFLWSVLLIVLARSATAQLARIANIPAADLPFARTVAYLERPTGPFSAARPVPRAMVEAFHLRLNDTAAARSPRRQLVGAAIGAVVGGLAGGTYAFLERQTGCKPLVGIRCDKPQHLWAYPVGGAAVGAFGGAMIARF